jgi:hypothetical protein
VVSSLPPEQNGGLNPLAKQILRSSWCVGRNLIAYWKYYCVFRRFRVFTMIPVMSYIRNLAVVERFGIVPGTVVECGVWKGGMIGGIASILGPEREYYLFDSCEGLPEAKEIDGEAALRWQGNKASPNYRDNCKEAVSFAQEAMRLAGAKRLHTIRLLRRKSIFLHSGPVYCNSKTRCRLV